MSNKLNIPNFLSGFRLIAAPFLISFAWTEHRYLFLALLAVSLFTDSIDGVIARSFKTDTEFGAKLDSWGDLATYLLVPLCAWWLWPEVIRRELFFVILVVLSFIFPIIAGLIKFRGLPSYHTWAAKTSAFFLSISAFILLITDIAWPFRISTILQAVAACEEIAITRLLPEPQSNVRSIWHLNRRCRN